MRLSRVPYLYMLVTEDQMESIRSIAIPPLTTDLERVLIDADTIQRRVGELADQINKDYAGLDKPLILV